MKKPMTRKLLLVVCSWSALAGSLCAQGIPAGYVPMATNGKALLENGFVAPAVYGTTEKPVTDGWTVKVGHAVWKKTADGVQSVWTSGHMPVLVFSGSFHDAVLEVDFRFHQEAGKWAACRLSPTNPTLNPRAYAASVWANENGTPRETGMVLEHDEWSPGVVTTVTRKPAAFESDVWYTLRMELIGNEVQATCNGVTVYGKHEKFGIAKTQISLGVGTCAHDLRNFRVYEAIPNPAWNKGGTTFIRTLVPVQGAKDVVIHSTPRILRFLNLPNAPTAIAITDVKGSVWGEWALPSQPDFQDQVGVQLSQSLPAGSYISIINFGKQAPLRRVFQLP